MSRFTRHRQSWLAAIAAGALLGSAGIAQATAAETGQSAPRLGQAPPEWDANPGAWVGSNYDLANTRHSTKSPINAKNVATMKVKWRFPFSSGSPWYFGAYASNPIVLDGVTYVQDLNSNVFALDMRTGRPKWERWFNSPDAGPNGLAYGWGLLFGNTVSEVFALDPRTGKTVWTHEITRNEHEGIDIAPQLYDGTVIVSTVPERPGSVYLGGAMGIVWALDARTGEQRWTFNTVKDGDLWGNPEINAGGGLWYPPAVDTRGRVFMGTGNPAPMGGTPAFPNGSSRPGDNLYTDSLVAVDGRTGELLWYRQVIPHDLRGYDLNGSPIVTHVDINGVRTEVVLIGGKSGEVFAFRAADGERLWKLSVGTHLNDVGPLPDEMTRVMPGFFGGVETPMAVADGRLFVPWVDIEAFMSSTGIQEIFPDFSTGRGGMTAVDPATGRVLWERRLPMMVFGAATVVNDVVFTSTYDGTIYALSAATGRTLWTTQARAGINGFPAVAGDTLLVGAGTWGFFPNPVFELTAYTLD